VDPDFAVSVREGDLLVADEAFGCGSAMEVAVTGARVRARSLPPFVLGILKAGGLMPYLRAHGGFVEGRP
jgi:hypothetical protein